MGITQQQLDTAVWGTGYGSKKHLVDHQRSRASIPSRRLRYEDRKAIVHVRCSLTTEVDSLDSSTNAIDVDLLAKRQPCVRCQKIADREESQP